MTKFVSYFDWPGRVLAFSDPHFGHANILRFERYQFKTIEDHDEKIINDIRSQVRPVDTLICLGDLGKNGVWEPLIDSIKAAKKVLVLGNHDNMAKEHYREHFDEIYPGPIIVNKYMMLSHEPVELCGNFLNVHGHMHLAYIEDDPFHVNANIHVLGYKLADLAEIYNKAVNICTKYNKGKFTHEWYGDKYQFMALRFDVPMFRDSLKIIPREFFLKVVGDAVAKLHKEIGENYYPTADEVLNYPFYYKEYYKELKLYEEDFYDDAIDEMVKFLKIVKQRRLEADE